MAPKIGELIRKNRHAWRIAVRNPFVASVIDGTVEDERLARWIVSARARMDNLFRLVCRLLAKAPSADRGILLEALDAITAELRWLDGWVGRRGIGRGARVNLVVRSQMSHHAALAYGPYVVGLVAFVTDFRLFVDSWRRSRSWSGRQRGLVRHWAESAARDWPLRLQKAADRALARATPGEIADVEAEVGRVIQDRLAFWTSVMD